MTSPSNGASFALGDSVTLTANAADPDGQVVKVEFYANGLLLGTVTSAPYSFVWNDIPSGVFNISARATDNSGAATTSLNVFFTGTRSPGSVNHAKERANSIVSDFDWTAVGYPGATGESPGSAAVVANLDALAFDIQQAYIDFTLERNLFGANAEQIATQLMAAYYFTRADAALAGQSQPSPNMKAHLQRVIGHLSITEDLMRYGSVTPATVQLAILVNARMDLAIGAAKSGLSPVADGQVSPGSLGSVFGDPPQTPLGTLTTFADVPSDKPLPFELEGVSASVGGRAVPLFFVSPGRVTFYVPKDLPAGENELIVVSQTGYVSKGVIFVVPNLTRIMTAAEDEAGPVFAVNDSKQMREAFPVTTSLNLSADKRTRVTFFATGVSGSAANTDASNDVTAYGKVYPNLAESVIVEARTQDNRVYQLPVEFAGARGVVPGLDQINVVLIPQLKNAGTVELALIVNGRRSNAPTIMVQ